MNMLLEHTRTGVPHTLVARHRCHISIRGKAYKTK